MTVDMRDQDKREVIIHDFDGDAIVVTRSGGGCTWHGLLAMCIDAMRGLGYQLPGYADIEEVLAYAEDLAREPKANIKIPPEV